MIKTLIDGYSVKGSNVDLCVYYDTEDKTLTVYIKVFTQDNETKEFEHQKDFALKTFNTFKETSEYVNMLVEDTYKITPQELRDELKQYEKNTT